MLRSTRMVECEKAKDGFNWPDRKHKRNEWGHWTWSVKDTYAPIYNEKESGYKKKNWARNGTRWTRMKDYDGKKKLRREKSEMSKKKM